MEGSSRIQSIIQSLNKLAENKRQECDEEFERHISWLRKKFEDNLPELKGSRMNKKGVKKSKVSSTRAKFKTARASLLKKSRLSLSSKEKRSSLEKENHKANERPVTNNDKPRKRKSDEHILSQATSTKTKPTSEPPNVQGSPGRKKLTTEASSLLENEKKRDCHKASPLKKKAMTFEEHREECENLTVVVLRAELKALGIKVTSKDRKKDFVRKLAKARLQKASENPCAGIDVKPLKIEDPDETKEQKEEIKEKHSSTTGSTLKDSSDGEEVCLSKPNTVSKPAIDNSDAKEETEVEEEKVDSEEEVKSEKEEVKSEKEEVKSEKEAVNVKQDQTDVEKEEPKDEKDQTDVEKEDVKKDLTDVVNEEETVSNNDSRSSVTEKSQTMSVAEKNDKKEQTRSTEQKKSEEGTDEKAEKATQSDQLEKDDNTKGVTDSGKQDSEKRPANHEVDPEHVVSGPSDTKLSTNDGSDAAKHEKPVDAEPTLENEAGSSLPSKPVEGKDGFNEKISLSQSSSVSDGGSHKSADTETESKETEVVNCKKPEDMVSKETPEPKVQKVSQVQEKETKDTKTPPASQGESIQTTKKSSSKANNRTPVIDEKKDKMSVSKHLSNRSNLSALKNSNEKSKASAASIVKKIHDNNRKNKQKLQAISEIQKLAQEKHDAEVQARFRKLTTQKEASSSTTKESRIRVANTNMTKDSGEKKTGQRKEAAMNDKTSAVKTVSVNKKFEEKEVQKSANASKAAPNWSKPAGELGVKKYFGHDVVTNAKETKAATTPMKANETKKKVNLAASSGKGAQLNKGMSSSTGTRVGVAGKAGNIINNLTSFIKKDTKPKPKKKARQDIVALESAKLMKMEQERKEIERQRQRDARRKIIEANKKERAGLVAPGSSKKKERRPAAPSTKSSSTLPVLPPRPNIGNTKSSHQQKSIKKQPKKEWDPEDNYVISDKDEDSDSGYESSEREQKRIPSWARGSKFREALRNQYEGKNRIDPDKLFGEIPVCDLEEIFQSSCFKKKSKYRQRGSSAMWHRDGLTIKEAQEYRVEMGLE